MSWIRRHPLGNSMLPLGNKKATGGPLTAANSRKGSLPNCRFVAAIRDQTAKSPNSRKGPQRIQAILSPEPGVRIPVGVLTAFGGSSTYPIPFQHSARHDDTDQIVFDAETGRTRVVMMFPHPESDGSAEMEGDGTVMYMRSSGSLPGGHEWMALDLSFGQELDTPLPANGDAKGELELLEAVTGDVREEGEEDLASHIEEEGTPLQVEAWIDADGLVRRMRLVKSEPREGGEGSMTIDMRMDFFDFGVVPEIDVPEPSEVFDATALAQDEVGLSNDD